MSRCCWCEAEMIEGEREDAGRPLTNDEDTGFLSFHLECLPKHEALVARLASKGVFIEIGPAS